MMVRLEHANLCVKNPDSMIEFLQTAFPDFKVRGEGILKSGARWLHVGADDTYIALQQAIAESNSDWKPYSGQPGVNHLAYEVDDVDSLRERMLAAGYEESTPPNSHPFRKRVYFYDSLGNDWEFVQYYSDDPAERNDYDTPD
jgi:uncharacterized glyoxalase superfamily protein PhnB